MAHLQHPPSALGPSVSLDGGAPIFVMGELLLVRIPTMIDFRIQADGVDTTCSTVNGSSVPSTSNQTSTQHFAFVRTVMIHKDGLELEVYPTVSFTNEGDGYNQLDEATQATLIPTQNLLGEPLSIRGCFNSNHAWLHVFPTKFIMPMSKPFRRPIPSVVISHSKLHEIDCYRSALLDNGPRQGLGQPLSGDESRNGPSQEGATIGQRWEHEGSQHQLPLLVLEGVDEDAQDADATMKDELMLMAYGDEMWTKELQKYLRAERREREEVQEWRAAMVESWLQDVI